MISEQLRYRLSVLGSNECSISDLNLQREELEDAEFTDDDLSHVLGSLVMTYRGSEVFAYAFDGSIKIGGNIKTIEEWIERYQKVMKWVEGDQNSETWKIQDWIKKVEEEMR